MTTPESLRQSTEDRSPLDELAERLESAWNETPVNLERYLPPPGSPARLPLLHDLVQRSLHIAWFRGAPRMLTDYLSRFPELGAEQDQPAALIFAEYRFRLLANLPVTLDEYRRRFPEQFPDLVRLIAADADTSAELTGTLCAPSPSVPPSIAARSGDRPATGDRAARVEPAKKDDRATAEPPDRVPTGGGTLHPDRPTLAPAPSTAEAPFPSLGATTDPHTIAGAPLPTDASSQVPLAASQVLPVSEGFKLFKRIGRGAFGEVFLAEAPGGINVAVKRIFRPLDDESSQRELHSLQLIRELRHPYLLQTQAYWSLEDRLVIVMELADDSLADWNKEVRKDGGEGISVEELIAYFREAAEALDYLHQMNVLHRDVKPANLLRLKGHAKVADFGLARVMEDKMAAATFCGTPLYMAPEVWKKTVCAQSDQYSLAIAYAELRTGKPVFSGTDYIEVCMKHTSGKPELDPLPEAEQRVLIRALAKKPEERYPDCVSFLDDLQAACAPPPPVVAPTRRGRGWVAAALVFGLLAVMGALLAVWAFTRPPSSPRVVQAQPAPLEPLLPSGCEPGGTEMDGRYYKRILHPLPGAASILFLFVPQSKPNEPGPFYIMRDKVSNGEFNAAAHDPAMGEPLKTDAQIKPKQSKGNPGDTKDAEVGPKWNSEGRGKPGEADLPVVYVTLPEARCFAHFLGGEVPTVGQWEKAAGRYDGAEGPFKPGQPPKGLAIAQYKKSGVMKPIQVGDPDGDESVFGCRDMADNGHEWTITGAQGELTNIPNGTAMKYKVYLRGAPFFADEVLHFADLLKQQSLIPQSDRRHETGFRVVIEAPRQQP